MREAIVVSAVPAGPVALHARLAVPPAGRTTPDLAWPGADEGARREGHLARPPAIGGSEEGSSLAPFSLAEAGGVLASALLVAIAAAAVVACLGNLLLH